MVQAAGSSPDRLLVLVMVATAWESSRSAL
jgi:hypothetical protein